MYKGSELLGKSVYALDISKEIDTVIKELILSQNRKKLIGFVVTQSMSETAVLVLPFERVCSFHANVAIVESQTALIPLEEKELQRILEQKAFKDNKVLTTKGQDVGIVVDTFFDSETGAVVGYAISEGLLADTYSGRSFLRATEEIVIQNNVIFVPPETNLIKNWNWGIQGAILKAKEKAQATSEKLEEAVITPGETVKNANQQIDQSNLQPKQSVIGKIVEQSVYTKSGTPLILRGQKVTPAIASAAQRWQVSDNLFLAANRPEKMLTKLAQARGKTVLHQVRSASGLSIASPGQIVNEQIIKQARLYQQEKALVEAVGISGNDNLDSSMQKSVAHFQAGAQPLHQGVNHLRQQVKKTRGIGDGQEEDQQLADALGRPVKQAIFDRQHQVILNVGELITILAVERAKQAGTLKNLLDAVYENET